MLILDYSFFAGEVLLVIGEYDDSNPITNTFKHEFMTSLTYVSTLFILPLFSLIVIRIRKYLLDEKIITEIKSKYLTLSTKISVISLVFSFLWITFVIYYDIIPTITNHE